MNSGAEWASCEPVCGDAMKLLLMRQSVGPKYLMLPAPTEEQVWLAAGAALRAPDHQKLLPFRLVLINDDDRLVLAELFADFARRSGRSDDEIAIEHSRAMRGPLLLAFVTRIERNHPQVPEHEQWLAAGGALANFMTALDMMGYGAKVLSGRKAADPVIFSAFCEPGETLIGWIAAGTPSKTPHPRHNDNPDAILRRWQPPRERETLAFSTENSGGVSPQKLTH